MTSIVSLISAWNVFSSPDIFRSLLQGQYILLCAALSRTPAGGCRATSARFNTLRKRRKPCVPGKFNREERQVREVFQGFFAFFALFAVQKMQARKPPRLSAVLPVSEKGPTLDIICNKS